MESRIYGKNIKISSTNVNEFWKHRSRKEGLKSVLLGKSCNNVEQNHRNEVEKTLLLSLLEKHSKFNIFTHKDTILPTDNAINIFI